MRRWICLLLLCLAAPAAAQCPDGRGRTLVVAFANHPFLPGDSLTAKRGDTCYGTSIVLPNGSATIPVRYNDTEKEIGETEWLSPRDKFRLEMWRDGEQFRIYLSTGVKRYIRFAFNPTQEVVILKGVELR